MLYISRTTTDYDMVLFIFHELIYCMSRLSTALIKIVKTTFYILYVEQYLTLWALVARPQRVRYCMYI